MKVQEGSATPGAGVPTPTTRQITLYRWEADGMQFHLRTFFSGRSWCLQEHRARAEVADHRTHPDCVGPLAVDETGFQITRMWKAGDEQVAVGIVSREVRTVTVALSNTETLSDTPVGTNEFPMLVFAIAIPSSERIASIVALDSAGREIERLGPGIGSSIRRKKPSPS